MLILFIITWIFMLITSWVISCTTIVDNGNYKKTFRLKSLFFWISIVFSSFSGYYLTK